jgi:tRNA(fMet)-specific endonuclease VapC
MIFVDTDVLIDFLNGCEPAASELVRKGCWGGLRTTVINRFELLAGARTWREEKNVRLLLAWIPALPLGPAAADQAAEIHRSLERKGTVIGRNDSLIAGIVLHHSGSLLTRNLRHFKRIPGLPLVSL